MISLARAAVAAVFLCGALLSGCGQKSDTSSAPTVQDAMPAPPLDQGAPAVDPAVVKARLAELPAPYDTADPAHGHVVFARCQVCHTVAEGGPDMTGPNLWGVFGRKAGSKPGYFYSDSVKALGFAWTAQRIDSWITNPRALAPGTKMSFAGLNDAKDRADVVAYLKTATTK
jgi:cytochrome c